MVVKDAMYHNKVSFFEKIPYDRSDLGKANKVNINQY